MGDINNCPGCGTDLRGTEIPDQYLEKGYYGYWDEDRGYYGEKPRHYSRKIGVEVMGVYDGVLFWQCPDCDAQWHRWSDPGMMVKAQGVMDEWQEKKRFMLVA